MESPYLVPRLAMLLSFSHYPSFLCGSAAPREYKKSLGESKKSMNVDKTKVIGKVKLHEPPAEPQRKKKMMKT